MVADLRVRQHIDLAEQRRGSCPVHGVVIREDEQGNRDAECRALELQSEF